MAESSIIKPDSTIMTTPIQTYFVASNHTATIQFLGHICVVFGLRQGSTNRNLAFAAEYWNGSVWHFGSGTGMEGVTIQKTSYSDSFTIKTAANIAIPFLILGGKVISDVAN